MKRRRKLQGSFTQMNRGSALDRSVINTCTFEKMFLHILTKIRKNHTLDVVAPYLSNFRECLTDDRKQPDDRASEKKPAAECVEDPRHVDLFRDKHGEETIHKTFEVRDGIYHSSDVKTAYHSLHHSDSHSSGIFSQVIVWVQEGPLLLFPGKF